MSTLAIPDLAKDAEREFRLVLGARFLVASCQTFAESSYRGGFHLTLTDAKSTCEVVYSDMQLEVSFNGKEVFGTKVHQGFEGNMFSREHLREYLPRIASSAAAGVRADHGQG